MAYLLDTNILLRWVQTSAPEHVAATQAMTRLLSQNEQLYLCPQNLIEFWNVVTRPIRANGLGLSIVRADKEVSLLEGLFTVLPDTPAIYAEWRRLAFSYSVKGKQVHDARIASVMPVHGVSHLLTFNGDDFKRFAHITPVHPNDL